jgi:hypothetical protein
MFYSLSSQMYKYEHGLSAIERRAEMARASEIAAGVRDLRLRLGRAFRSAHRLQPAPGGKRGDRAGTGDHGGTALSSAR